MKKDKIEFIGSKARSIAMGSDIISSGSIMNKRIEHMELFKQ